MGIDIDLGFNTSHNHEEEATETIVHIHTVGKKQQYQDEATCAT